MRTLFFFLFFIPFVCFSQNISYDEGDKLKNGLGINLGVITYSFRNMPDQSPLAILEYVKQSGIYNIELWGKHAEPFAGSPISPFDDPVNRRVLSKQSRKIKLTDEEKSALENTLNAVKKTVAETNL